VNTSATELAGAGSVSSKQLTNCESLYLLPPLCVQTNRNVTGRFVINNMRAIRFRFRCFMHIANTMKRFAAHLCDKNSNQQQTIAKKAEVTMIL
jgi:hypothetical protein